MSTITEEELLEAVRNVFAGVTKRAQVCLLPPRAQVYVAVAVILTFPDYYLYDGRLRMPLSQALRMILRDGVDTDIPAPNYGHICRRAGLYQVISRQGSHVSIRLMPPSSLRALLSKLDVTPAIKVFHDEVVRVAIEGFNDQTAGTETALTLAAAERIVARLYRQGGTPLLQAVLAVITRRLQQ